MQLSQIILILWAVTALRAMWLGYKLRKANARVDQLSDDVYHLNRKLTMDNKVGSTDAT